MWIICLVMINGMNTRAQGWMDTETDFQYSVDFSSAARKLGASDPHEYSTVWVDKDKCTKE